MGSFVGRIAAAELAADRPRIEGTLAKYLSCQNLPRSLDSCSKNYSIPLLRRQFELVKDG